jgi:hypothetical protein
MVAASVMELVRGIRWLESQGIGSPVKVLAQLYLAVHFLEVAHE